jgi:hypothetical protein
MNFKPVVFTALLLFVSACSPSSDEVDLTAKLEKTVSDYEKQLDAMNSENMSLNARVNAVKSQMDSSRSVNRTLVAKLQEITRESKRFQGLYKEQVGLNRQLRGELSKARNALLSEHAAKEAAIKRATALETQLAEKDRTLLDQENRIKRLENRLKRTQEREASAIEAMEAVLVYQGTMEDLKAAGYLSVRQKTIFTDEYKVIKFPDETDRAVLKATIGRKIALKGNLKLLADRDGSLSKGNEYTVTENGELVFEDETLKGQRVLVVLK